MNSLTYSNEIINKYMMGYCHGLAFALSSLTGKPVEVIFAVKKNGKRVPDPLHVYVNWDNGMILDVKGIRKKEEMIKDFKFIFDMIEDAESISFEELDDPEALFYEYGMNPDAVQDAIMDLSEGLSHLQFDTERREDPLRNNDSSPDF